MKCAVNNIPHCYLLVVVGLSRGTVLSSAEWLTAGDAVTCGGVAKGSELPPGAGELRCDEDTELEGVTA